MKCLGLAALLALALPLVAAECTGGAPAGGRASEPEFGEAFWSRWGDGQAEVAAYDLTLVRYGEERRGVAVAIFVTETFSNRVRVKADPGKHPAADEFPVLKLNLVQDFPTGLYDYNLMTSVFTALVPVNGLPAGAATKVSFSAQEWCGHVWHQLLFGPSEVRSAAHSYFDGEADRQETLPLPQEGLSEDALLSWARGFAGPVLTPGETRSIPLLDALRCSRFRHEAPAWRTARLSRSAGSRSVTVPAGTFEVETWEATVAGGRSWSILVEATPPHRIVSWTHSEGESAELLKLERLKYWEMNGPGLESQLSRLGLGTRPPRTP